MNREHLKALGLTDEQIDEVMKEHGKTVNGIKEQLNSATTELDELKSQIADRDAQLEKLKKDAGNNEELKKQIQTLQDENKAAKEKYEADMKKLRVITASKLAIANDVHDIDVALSLIDTSKIELDESGNIKAGLDDQVKALRESKAFLFVEKQDSGKTIKGATPADGKDPGASGKQNNVGTNFAKMANQKNTGVVSENNPWN